MRLLKKDKLKGYRLIADYMGYCEILKHDVKNNIRKGYYKKDPYVHGVVLKGYKLKDYNYVAPVLIGCNFEFNLEIMMEVFETISSETGVSLLFKDDNVYIGGVEYFKGTKPLSMILYEYCIDAIKVINKSK